jgi:hypothetical protein
MTPILVSTQVDSMLEYGFFPGTPLRAPTQEEIDGLIVETNKFYTDLLTSIFPNFFSFEVGLISVDFNPQNRLPVRMNFNAIGFFTGGEKQQLL